MQTRSGRESCSVQSTAAWADLHLNWALSPVIELNEGRRCKCTCILERLCLAWAAPMLNFLQIVHVYRPFRGNGLRIAQYLRHAAAAGGLRQARLPEAMIRQAC